jgi:hypothetical protein
MKKIFCYGRVGRFVRRVGAACHSLCSGVFATNSRRARGLGSVGFVAGRSSAGYPPGMQRCRGLAAVELIAAAGASAVGGARLRQLGERPHPAFRRVWAGNRRHAWRRSPPWPPIATATADAGRFGRKGFEACQRTAVEATMSERV